MKHVFVLEDAVLDTLTQEEVEATAVAMGELGLFKTPYESGVYIRVTKNALFKLLKFKSKVEDLTEVIEVPPVGDRDRPVMQLCDLPRDGFDPWAYRPPLSPGYVVDEVRREVLSPLINTLGPETGLPMRGGGLSLLLNKALVVVLAARGYSREEAGRQTKLQKLQGKNKDGIITTYIGLDQRYVRAAMGGTHASPRMHLRRAHARRFQNGVLLEKPKLIEATLVCAEADFMVTRTAYTVH